MRAVTLHAFGVTLCMVITITGKNAMIKTTKTYRYRKDRFVFFILPFLFLRTSSFNQCN